LQGKDLAAQTPSVLEEKMTYAQFVGTRSTLPSLAEEVKRRLNTLHDSVSQAIESGAHVQEYQVLQTAKYNVSLEHCLISLFHIFKFDFSSSMRPENATANRYRNILAQEDTLVRLRDPEAYINANLIHVAIGDGHPLNLILTQAPLSESSQQFWQMVLEQECPCIVMLTAEVEFGRVKSHSYWPKQAGSSMAFGHLVVSAMDVQEGAAFQSTLMRIIDTRTAKVRHHILHLVRACHRT
jgi:protein tyrosine phosphatase